MNSYSLHCGERCKIIRSYFPAVLLEEKRNEVFLVCRSFFFNLCSYFLRNNAILTTTSLEKDVTMDILKYLDIRLAMPQHDDFPVAI